MESFASLQGVSKLYRDGKRTTQALRDLTFDITAQEFFVIIGESGCGKSTLIRLLSGLTAPDRGYALVRGSRVVKPLSNVGIVFQTPLLLRWRRVIDNVLLPVEILGRKKESFRRQAMDLLHLAGIDGFEHSWPWQLSIGMQQRVALCRALIHDPSLLLMDEPFSALDALTLDEMDMELLRIWRERKKTVLFVTHNIQEATLLADRVLVMTPRPGQLSSMIRVDLPRPRDHSIVETAQYHALCGRIRDGLREASGATRGE